MDRLINYTPTVAWNIEIRKFSETETSSYRVISRGIVDKREVLLECGLLVGTTVLRNESERLWDLILRFSDVNTRHATITMLHYMPTVLLLLQNRQTTGKQIRNRIQKNLSHSCEGESTMDLEYFYWSILHHVCNIKCNNRWILMLSSRGSCNHIIKLLFLMDFFTVGT